MLGEMLNKLLEILIEIAISMEKIKKRKEVKTKAQKAR